MTWLLRKSIKVLSSILEYFGPHKLGIWTPQGPHFSVKLRQILTYFDKMWFQCGHRKKHRKTRFFSGFFTKHTVSLDIRNN